MKIEDIQYNPETGVLSYKDGTPIKMHLMGGTGSGEYWSVSIGGMSYYVHRIAFFCMEGAWPTRHVDHINGIKTDNRWFNLRLATMAQNKANEGIRSSNTSGWKGVSWHKAAKKWRAYIGARGRHLGLYDCPAAAHLSYLVAASVDYGKFARGS